MLYRPGRKFKGELRALDGSLRTSIMAPHLARNQILCAFNVGGQSQSKTRPAIEVIKDGDSVGYLHRFQCHERWQEAYAGYGCGTRKPLSQRGGESERPVDVLARFI
jgi:hypothetical protein